MTMRVVKVKNYPHRKHQTDSKQVLKMIFGAHQGLKREKDRNKVIIIFRKQKQHLRQETHLWLPNSCMPLKRIFLFTFINHCVKLLMNFRFQYHPFKDALKAIWRGHHMVTSRRDLYTFKTNNYILITMQMQQGMTLNSFLSCYQL